MFRFEFWKDTAAGEEEEYEFKSGLYSLGWLDADHCSIIQLLKKLHWSVLHKTA